MEVHLFNEQQDLTIADDGVFAVVNEVLKKEGHFCDELSIHFVNAQKISDLHAEFFDDPSVTDCISFPIDPPSSSGYCVLGEVFVCPKVAIDYAHAHQLSIGSELTLYIVHGILHLLGYDDQGDEEPEMRRAEMLHMKNLEVHNLILTVV